VLTPSIALERLQPVARRDAKVVESHRGIEDRKLPQSWSDDPRVERPDALAPPESLGFSVPE
jgi:hypothetical protein